jgi:hypothetical protein
MKWHAYPSHFAVSSAFAYEPPAHLPYHYTQNDEAPGPIAEIMVQLEDDAATLAATEACGYVSRCQFASFAAQQPQVLTSKATRTGNSKTPSMRAGIEE